MKFFFCLLMVLPILLFVNTGDVLAQTGGVNTSSGFTTGVNDSDGFTTGVNREKVNERSTGIKNPLKVDAITDLFNIILDIVMIFAIPIIVLFIIYAGFLYVTARGNVDIVQKAHQAILYSLLGAVIILGAKALMVIISGTVDSILK